MSLKIALTSVRSSVSSKTRSGIRSRLSFENGVANAIEDGLYFAAGPNDESDGLFGVIIPEDRDHK